jgi:phage gp29-like protein
MIKLFSKKKDNKKEIAPALPRTNTVLYRYPLDTTPGLRQFEEMLQDPLVRSAVTVKKLGALSVPWSLEPSGNAEIDAFIAAMFDEMEGSPTGVLFDALDAIAKGYAVLEKLYDTGLPGYGSAVWVRAVKPKDPALFGFDVDEFLNIDYLVLHVPGSPGVELPIDKFVVYAYNRRYSQPYGESDLLAAYKHWRIKRALIDQWNAHLEKFASPSIVGKFERGLSVEEQQALLDSLDKVQRQSALIHADDIDVTLLDGRRTAESGYLEAIDYHNREIARAILGQTLTTDDSRKVGSLALGKVHLQVLIMQLNGLRRDVAERVMNEQIIRPTVDMNFADGVYPRFVFEEPELDVFRTGKVV